MKKVAVFFPLPQAMDYPLSKADYWSAYAELTKYVQDQGGQLYIVRGQETYKGNGVFSNSWIINNDQLEETGEVQVESVFDKGRFISDKTAYVFNTEKVNEFCGDKWLTYQSLKEYFPLTIGIQNNEELLLHLDEITTDKVVFKPVDGAEGKDIYIENKDFFQNTAINFKFPAIIQAFLDTSSGVPGIYKGIHDLRIAVFNGEIIYSYLRTPPQGQLLANVAQGGQFRMLDITTLPQEAIDIVKIVDQRFIDSKYRFYSVDFGFTAEGPKIIELNALLGLLPNKDGEIFKTVKQKIAEALIQGTR